MKNLQKELLSISKTISTLASKVEKMAEAVAASGKPAPKKAAPAKKAKAKAAPKRSAKKAAPAAKKDAVASTLDNIYGMISRSRDGITVALLKKKTGLAIRQVNNSLYKLKQKGKIETIKRGVYVTKKG